ncbi:flagellar motor stator protein MotA [Pseudoxanthomonas daejeonensis]|uniref:Flagellar motor stator protein MotA n=1 Tax=Pseudoxanthomonas daejeonensis TaxID=266062 RepID=A0ABQ6Z647_9GAMM|nr:flagellar motor stator protein MotA [Pseudoxanthomonas daejeonensis]KAF1694001.1 flagellar motor stator protein MotA [Pseudoxanthomonas daejeonensis]UNK57339.1 flagellar motor stator protein MotA [Pseudoxanthomonas daejeonensis]
MLIIIGFIIVIVSVLGGFVLSHGKLAALWQPYEVLIIGGAAFGAFLVANPLKVVKAAIIGIPGLLKGARYKRNDYVDILSMVYDVLVKARKEGMIGIEKDIDNPGSSPVFSKYPKLLADHHLMEFTTDCLRLMVSGNMEPHELEQLLEIEVETHHQEAAEPAHALQVLADSLPGFGIVAAVLGIVVTMASIGGDVATIGHHVAAALVGTFLGILLGYGFVGPLAASMAHRAHEEGKAFEIIKMALVSSLRGYPPSVAVEFARKLLFSDVRPAFADLEAHLRSNR